MGKQEMRAALAAAKRELGELKAENASLREQLRQARADAKFHGSVTQ